MHILDAAKELIAAEGMDRTSMDDIAAKAEYSNPQSCLFPPERRHLLQHRPGVYGHAPPRNCWCLEKSNRFEERYFAICDLLTDFADMGADVL
jgi:hypothetical protein